MPGDPDDATPRTVADRTLVSERLRRLEVSNDGIHSAIDGLHLVQQQTRDGVLELVHITRLRDDRETEQFKHDLDERVESKKWIRGFFSKELIIPLIVSAITGASVGRASLWVAPPETAKESP